MLAPNLPIGPPKNSARYTPVLLKIFLATPATQFNYCNVMKHHIENENVYTQLSIVAQW